MCERIQRTDARYDTWLDTQNIGISHVVGDIPRDRIQPIVDRTREDLAVIFNAMPESYREFIKLHAQKLTVSEIADYSEGIHGHLYCPVTGFSRRPLVVTMHHEYYLRSNENHSDSRYIEFTAMIEDTPGNGHDYDGMRMTEDVRLNILTRASDELVNHISVEIGEVVDNENHSSIRLYIHESGEVELFVDGVSFDKTIDDVLERFPQLGKLVQPSAPFHRARFRGSEATWKLSMPLAQAKEFRNAVRAQIVHKIEDYRV